ncbi:MAG: U32 family peptidase [Erysipelotrichaceae bacterium]
MKKIELLSPAGDLHRLKTAIRYGADAVYIGGKKFSLRSRASNFDIDDIAEGVIFAKQYGARIHVTVNMLPHDDDLVGLKEYLITLESIGVSAIIVASPYIAMCAKQYAPKLEVHISTQHSSTNSAAANYWKSKGMDRVVLARECTLNQIVDTSHHTDIPLEVFIHGGMCISYSGRCTLSNHMTNRDANRGGCAQSCRWNYHLYDGDKLISKEDDPFSMSSKDLMAARFIPNLIDAGIASLKIEGRMKSTYYIAVLIKTYRNLIDEYYEKGKLSEERFAYYEKEFAKAENRPTATGFYQGSPSVSAQLYDLNKTKPHQEYIAYVLDYDSDTHMATIEVRNHFSLGEEVEVFGPNCNNEGFTIKNLMDEDGCCIEVANNPMKVLRTEIPFEVHRHDMIRKRRD